MGFFRRKKEDVEEVAPGVLQVTGSLMNGDGHVDVVGESHFQRELDQIAGGKCEDGHDFDALAALLPVDDNPHDPNAVQVQIQQMIVGYLSREDAKAYRPVLRTLARERKIGLCLARVRGGWRRAGGDEGHYGVILFLAPPERALQDPSSEAIALADTLTGKRD